MVLGQPDAWRGQPVAQAVPMTANLWMASGLWPERWG